MVVQGESWQKSSGEVVSVLEHVWGHVLDRITYTMRREGEGKEGDIGIGSTETNERTAHGFVAVSVALVCSGVAIAHNGVKRQPESAATKHIRSADKS